MLGAVAAHIQLVQVQVEVLEGLGTELEELSAALAPLLGEETPRHRPVPQPLPNWPTTPPPVTPGGIGFLDGCMPSPQASKAAATAPMRPTLPLLSQVLGVHDFGDMQVLPAGEDGEPSWDSFNQDWHTDKDTPTSIINRPISGGIGPGASSHVEALLLEALPGTPSGLGTPLSQQSGTAYSSPRGTANLMGSDEEDSDTDCMAACVQPITEPEAHHEGQIAGRDD